MGHVIVLFFLKANENIKCEHFTEKRAQNTKTKIKKICENERFCFLG